MRPVLILCAAALLSFLGCGQVVTIAGAIAASYFDGRRPISPDDRNGGSVVTLSGGFVDAGVRDVFDTSDVWSQPRGIDGELGADGAQTFAEDGDWDEWIGRRVRV